MHNDAFTFLIDKGADVNLQDHDGYTALHHAVETKNFDAISCLVHNGADVNLFTFSKRTPLMLACESHIQNMDAINFLLNKGADVNLQDRRGYTSLHHAVKSKNFDASSCLVYASFFKQRSDISHAKEQARYTLCMPRSLRKDPT